MTSSKVPWRLGIAALRARKELVPGGELGGRPVDQDLELGLVAGRVGADAGAAHQLADALAEQDLQLATVIFGMGLELLEQRRERLLVGPLGLGVGALDQQAAFGQLEADVQTGIVLLHDLGAPALEQVAPGRDRIEIAGVAGDREPAAPAVVVDERHRRLAPVPLVLRAILDAGGDLVVAVAEDVGLDLDHVADHPLDRMPAAVELRLDPLDHDPVGGERPQALLARPGEGRGGRRRRPASLRLGPAPEDPELQGLERDRVARLEGDRREPGASRPRTR